MKLKFAFILLCFSLFQAVALDLIERSELIHLPSPMRLKNKINEVVINPAFTEITGLHEKLAYKKIYSEEISFQVHQAMGRYFDYLQRYSSEEKINVFMDFCKEKKQLLVSEITKMGKIIKYQAKL